LYNEKKQPKKEVTIRSSAAEYLTFVASEGNGGVDVMYADENIWLTQQKIAELFGVQRPTINF